MVRKFDPDSPLSAEDLTYLRERHSEPYVERMILLHGGAEEAEEGEDGGQEPPEPPEEPPAQPESSEAESEAESEAGDGEDDEDDLIGAAELYDPFDHTTQEVRDHMKSADEAERERVRQLELGRTDREPRTSITGYNPS